MEYNAYKKHTLLEIVLLYLTPFIYWTGFDYVGFDASLLKLVMFAYTLFLLFYCSRSIFTKRYKRGTYSWYMRCWIYLVFISILMSYLFWGQSMSLGFRATGMYFAFLYYFVLLKIDATKEDVIRVIGFYSVLYLLLYLYGISQFPVSVFSSGDEIDEMSERGGILRLSIKSFDVVCLLFFYALAKTKDGRVIKVLPIVLFGFVMIFLSLSRMVIAASILITVFFVIKRVKFRNQVIIIVLVMVGAFLLRNNSTINDVVDSLFEMTEDQLQDTDVSNTNLRLVEYKTALSYPRNVVTWFFGCGCPHPFSKYGKYELSLVSNIGFNRSDAGYPAILITFGILGLIIFCSLIVKSCRINVMPDYAGFKMYLIFIALVNLFQNATSWFAIAICLSLYMLNCNESKNKINNKHEYSNKNLQTSQN